MTTRRIHRALAVAFLFVAGLITTSPQALAAGDPVVDAQQLIYEMNLARWNPAEYAARSGATVPAGTLARPPVAINASLTGSAMFKANEIADNGYFAHQSEVTGIWPNQLARDHGYSLPGWWLGDANYIESLHGGSPDPFNVLGSFAGSPSHRAHIFGEGAFAEYNEIGVGRSTNLNYWAVHTAYSDAPKTFITGVVFDDTNGNQRMDLGEGVAGESVTAGSRTAVTNAGGGYAIRVSPGTYNVASGGAAWVVEVGAYNVGVDFVRGRSTPIVRSYETCQGFEPTILGTNGRDELHATASRDVIHGFGGGDIVIGLGADDVVCGISNQSLAVGEGLRLAGVDRYVTAVEISQATYPGGAGVVYLASGLNFPDALAGGPAAAAERAPILLANRTGIPAATGNELLRLQPSTVVILGGEAALGSGVAAQVRSLLPGATIDRRGGSTRYETAVSVSKRAFPNGADTVYVATGEDFPDAVAAIPAAAAAGGPLLLVPRDQVPAAVAAELARLDPGRIVVLGDTTAVSNQVFAQLSAYADQGALRVAGSDRYATAVEASKQTFRNGASTVYIATGTNYPDALTGGAATAFDHGPILLVTTTTIPSVVATELTRLAPTRIVIFGGPAAVSEAVASQLARYLP